MTTQPETEMLPPELVSGYVYNRILRVIGDQSYDQDRFPDGLPAEGTVTFKPKTAVRQVASDGKGTTLTREPVICTIYDGYDDPSQAGELVDEAGHIGGVWLAEGAYTVSYQFTDRYSNAPDIDIIVTDEYTEDNPLDVALQAGIEPTPGIKFVVNEQIYLDSLKARNEAEYWAGVSEEMATVGPKGDLPVHVSETPPEDTDVIWVNPSEPSVTPSEYALEASQYADVAANEADRAQGVADLLGNITIGGEVPITIDTSVGTRVFIGDTMIHGDTGWRDIRDLLPEFWEVQPVGQQRIHMKRENDTVYLVGRVAYVDTGTSHELPGTTPLLPNSVPNGFRSTFGFSLAGLAAFYTGSRVSSSNGQGEFFFSGSANLSTKFSSLTGSWRNDNGLGFSLTWQTDDPWPTSLPGLPA